MIIAIIGATGLVGKTMLEILEERNFPFTELILAASEKSVGKKVIFGNKEYQVVSVSDALKKQPTIALFSAGGNTSLEWAEKFASVGTYVIDNSSAWRMDASKKLVVPEINGHLLDNNDHIIANPNCSTIQLVMALAPLHKKYGIKRLVISTYQSVSGTGSKAIEQMENERKGENGEMAYPYPIDKNCIPHCDVFLENGYTKEEMKLVNETRKILGDQSLNITATAVRIPTTGGHSEAVNVEFQQDFELIEVRKLLSTTPGIVLKDDPTTNTYPMPIYSKGKDEVFVGRIRRDESQPNTLNLWVVSDNLRKGAATNAVQIAECLLEKEVLTTPLPH